MKLITFTLVSGADNIILDTKIYSIVKEFSPVFHNGAGVFSPLKFLSYIVKGFKIIFRRRVYAFIA